MKQNPALQIDPNQKVDFEHFTSGKAKPFRRLWSAGEDWR